MLEHISDIYSKYVTQPEKDHKTKIWKILASDCFQNCVSLRGPVLYLSSVDGKFINTIQMPTRVDIDFTLTFLSTLGKLKARLKTNGGVIWF